MLIICSSGLLLKRIFWNAWKNVWFLKKGRIQNILYRGVHLFACHYDTQVCSIIIKVYCNKHISVMAFIKAVFNALKAISYQRSWNYSLSGCAHGLMISSWGCRKLMFHCSQLQKISITVTLKRFIIIFAECWIMGYSNALKENKLDIAAKFQSMAFNYQPSDVKVRPCYCLFI